MLCEGRRTRPLLALRALCWNFTSLRGRVMLATSGGAGCAGVTREQPKCATNGRVAMQRVWELTEGYVAGRRGAWWV
jgi:hypothetical protein